MSETTHTDEEQAEDYCNLDETEHYAFELGVKEIIREAVDESPDFAKGKNTMIEDIDGYNTEKLFDRGVYSRIKFAYDSCSRKDLFRAVADNPIIEIAELDKERAVLVHADYLNEYYDMMEELRAEDEE
ncbi:hypothetical protein OSG_eHP2_00055 [environmental Halophage eHP-2]|nr:hypothetical protein OSG_eHP2_00055 [environmental Halophage eHP-2]UXF50095.1 hypothetical protein 7865G3C2_39 [Haloquadratum phage sp.]